MYRFEEHLHDFLYLLILAPNPDFVEIILSATAIRMSFFTGTSY
ncbi:hypothetical protein BLGI_747 [Brevibacillus laterosporus GI-9]|nr:hypothetical protein BLGI_747 [Brevibacillus laterosporus GI-9]